MNAVLYVYTADGLTYNEAIEQCKTIFVPPDDLAFALLYTPQRCLLSRFDANATLRIMPLVASDTPKDAKSQLVPTESIFEARLFNTRAELRWLHSSEGKGCVALLAEDSTLSVFQARPREEDVVSSIDQRYLLWGEGTGLQFQEGWSQMATARIGAYMVPLANIRRHERVQFTAIEYLKEYDYGNVGVFEERLTGLTPAQKESTDG